MDDVEARRTLIGAPVVHGVHLAAAALEKLLVLSARPLKVPFLAALETRFPRPAMVGEMVECRLVEHGQTRFRLEASVGSDVIMEAAATLNESSSPNSTPTIPLREETLRDLRLEEMEAQAGTMDVGIDMPSASRDFPQLVARLGSAAFAEVIALSRLVGMRCPGRHSLFAGFDVTFGASGMPAGIMSFKVARVDPRFRSVGITVQASQLGGTLATFHRPPPQAQRSMEQTAALVARDEFVESAPLIVGGSRGLGEATAKIIAAGGGRPIITYHQGAQDAERLAREIEAWGGKCEIERLDVHQPRGVVQRIFKRRSPRSLYYFATPHIFARRRAFVAAELLRRFMDLYVDGFVAVLDAVPEGRPELRVFYPSTVAIAEHDRSTVEYAIAKRAAEDICAAYNRYSNKVEIVVERLPRTKTDQTAALFEMPACDAVDVMLPSVRRIEASDVSARHSPSERR